MTLTVQVVTLAQGTEGTPGRWHTLRRRKTLELRFTDVPVASLPVQALVGSKQKTAHTLLVWAQGGEGCILVNVVHYLSHLLGNNELWRTRQGGHSSLAVVPVWHCRCPSRPRAVCRMSSAGSRSGLFWHHHDRTQPCGYLQG